MRLLLAVLVLTVLACTAIQTIPETRLNLVSRARTEPLGRAAEPFSLAAIDDADLLDEGWVSLTAWELNAVVPSASPSPRLYSRGAHLSILPDPP
jgi:hypothetical protein